jgi:23S rRNA pseudouridine955/2504/2580 synthase/23S rRNA pseudouridine1911/1915/1917 synthase
MKNFESLDQRIIRTTCDWSCAGQELANYLASRFTYRTKDEWLLRIDSGEITLNGRKVSPEYRLELHDQIEYRPVDIVEPDADLNCKVVFEDENYLVVDKPGNLCIHPAGPFFKHTLWHVLASCYGEIHFASRLDRETSGLLLAAKNKSAAAKMAKKNIITRKSYLAVVHGSFSEAVEAKGFLVSAPASAVRKKRQFVYDMPQEKGGFESAHTQLVPEICGKNFSLVRANPLTGRMHQIRATLSSFGYPVAGDKLYGVDETMFLRQSRDELTPEDREKLIISRQALHSAHLEFIHPESRENMSFDSELPDELKKLTVEGDL